MGRINKDEVWDTEIAKWRKFETETRTYLIPVEGSVAVGDLIKSVPIVNPADNIHTDLHDPKSDGYGGRTMTFPLNDGTEYVVKGPWHGSGSTGDLPFRISDLHYTFVTIGTDHPSDVEWFMSIPDEFIIYQDPGFVLGPFMRGDRLALQLANSLNKRLYVVRESMGGSSAHWVSPGDTLHSMACRPEDR